MDDQAMERMTSNKSSAHEYDPTGRLEDGERHGRTTVVGLEGERGPSTAAGPTSSSTNPPLSRPPSPIPTAQLFPRPALLSIYPTVSLI